MKVSGKEVAEAISEKLQKKVQELGIKPCLAIILAGSNPASRIYVNNKIKAAEKIGVKTKFFEFSEDQFEKVVKTIEELNADNSVHGIIIQYPTYESWNFDDLFLRVDPKKDVDGFGNDSPFKPATALAVWEMLTAFALLEKFSRTEDFLKDKNIVVLGRGKTAGAPTKALLESRGFKVEVITRDTENPDEIIRESDIVISATGQKNIVNGSNVRTGSYVIGVGVGREIVEGAQKTFGDINEEEISQIAKLYCPTIGGIGPLTIVSLLENVVSGACHFQEKTVESAKRAEKK